MCISLLVFILFPQHVSLEKRSKHTPKYFKNSLKIVPQNIKNARKYALMKKCEEIEKSCFYMFLGLEGS